MNRFALRIVADLVPAAGAVGHHDGIGLLAHGGQQAEFGHLLGTGLGKVKGKVFRIGHLGDCNDLTLMAALSGCEMGLKLGA